MSVTPPHAIKTFIESEEDPFLLQQHLQEIVEGAAFRKSHRSGQFLKYIVEHAISGDTDSLKEGVIGVEFFGRSPSYDTGEDAIVRVTNTRVTRRLGKLVSTSKAMLCLVELSITLNTRMRCPPAVPSFAKSMDHS